MRGWHAVGQLLYPFIFYLLYALNCVSCIITGPLLIVDVLLLEAIVGTLHRFIITIANRLRWGHELQVHLYSVFKIVFSSRSLDSHSKNEPLVYLFLHYLTLLGYFLNRILKSELSLARVRVLTR